jgi:hypothetical protein
MATPMTLEGCAEIRAEMDAGHLRDNVLARAGLSVDEWVVSQRAWLDEMGRELEGGRFELTDRYTLAFLDRKRALEAALPPPPREAAPPRPIETMPPANGDTTLPMTPWPGPKAPPALPFSPGAVAPGFPGTSPQRRPVVVESEVKTAPIAPLRIPLDATTASLDAPSWESGTALPERSPLARAPLPFQPAPPTPTGAPLPPPRPPPISAAARGGSVPKPPESAAGESKDPPDWATSTTAVAPSFLRAALPFKATTPTPAATPAPQPTSLTGSTSSMQSPFAPARSEAVPPSAQPPAPAPARPARRVPPPLPSKRVPVPPQSQPASPASGPASRATWTVVDGGLSLEQHASLCVELARDPAQTAAALARYRLTAERKAELDLLWKARFSADPALEIRWKEAYRLYADFLATRRT